MLYCLEKYSLNNIKAKFTSLAFSLKVFECSQPQPLLEIFIALLFTTSVTTNTLTINLAKLNLVDWACLHVRDLLNNGSEPRVGLRHSCLAIFKQEWLQHL